jgi:hypothetical protein
VPSTKKKKTAEGRQLVPKVITVSSYKEELALSLKRNEEPAVKTRKL